MKKILLIIFTIILILSVNVLAVDIDVGSPAITRDVRIDVGETYILKENPANADGKITSVEIYTGTAMSGCIIATFYVVTGNVLSARDSQYIGNVPGYSKQTLPVDIEIKAGDYIGLYFSGGKVESSESGFAGLWHKPGDQTSSSDVGYSVSAGDTISLYGIGETVVVGWDHKWNTKNISKWNTKEIVKWNGLE
ncbi:hypothetical protein ES705_41271 [subsurface metagenome]